MTAAAPTDLDPSPRCRQALHEIDRLIDAGLPVDRAALLLQYADVADELRVHFELADQLRGLSELIPAPCSPAAPTVPEAIASFGDYEVLERIGGGGMGVVFKARQRSLNRLVALKFPAGGALAGAEAVERFRQEAQTLAQLHHPHIVGVYEVGVHEGRTYFSMEYVDGANLETLLRENPPPPEQAVEWARVIAAAIDYAHRQGIVHRDLKPANILIDVAGTVRIADFGLGKLLASDHSLTQTGQILGTLRYMAPEQADGTADPSPEAADIYSIGAILYELVSGRPAFWASSAVGLIRQIHEQEPLPLRQLDSRVPKDLETICLKCLSKSPADRYLAAGELADDLRRYLNGEPVVARPVSRSERLWRWCRRRPLVAGLSAATLMTIVAAAVVSTYFGWVAIQERQAAIDAKAVAEQNAQAAAQQEQLAKAELARSEGLLYAGQIARAQRAWDDADLPAAWEALSACKPELRGWEHDYLFTLFTANQRTLRGHARRVMGVIFTPDGRRLVSGSWDKTIKVWDVETLRELMTLSGHTEHVEGIAVSPDGRLIASASWDDTAKVWDAETGRELLTFRGHTGDVNSVKFSLDGARIVSGSDDMTVKIWDSQTGEEYQTLSGHADFVLCVAVHPEGRWLASGSRDRTVRLWDMETGEQLSVLRDDTGHVECVAFSPDGQCLAAGGRSTLIYLWRLSGITPAKVAIELLGHTNGVNDLVFVPGKGTHHFVSGSYDGTLKVWVEPFRRAYVTLKGHTRNVFCTAVSPDGTQIASGGEDKTIKLWDTRWDPRGWLLDGHTEYVTCVDVSSDGRWIVSGSDDDSLKLWDARDAMAPVPYDRTHPALIPRSTKALATFSGHTGDVTSVAFGPDHSWVASASADQTIKVWNVTSATERLTLTGHAGPVSCVAVSRDGTRIISGGDDATIRIWDADSGSEVSILTGHEQAVTCLAVSPDGKRLCSGSADRTVKLWDADTGRALLTLTGHSDRVRTVAFSPGGQIVSGSDDQTLKIWDVASGKEVRTLRSHAAQVSSVAVSPDGTRIVSASHDHTLKLWDASQGYETVSLVGAQFAIRCVRFSPDGRYIVSGGQDQPLKLWDASLRFTGSPLD